MVLSNSNFLKNLRKSVSHGLDKSLALAALTTVPASYLNIQKDLGTIEKGKIANFIICSKDIFEDGVIYENWVAGKKYEVNKKQELDVRGFYTFSSDELENKLAAIKGTKEKPKATIFLLDSLALKTSLSDNEINVNTKDGDFRLVGTFSAGKISGRYQDADGIFHNFLMVRDSLFVEKKKEIKVETDSIIPKIWMPNKAYGFIQKPSDEIIIFKNATVWTNESEGILENTDVVIKDGKIIAIGKEIDLSEILDKEVPVKTIDASSKHITCGIIDEHSHIAIRRGVNESSQAVTAEVRIGDVINANDINIYRQLSGGVTTSQLLHGSDSEMGGPTMVFKPRRRT